MYRVKFFQKNHRWAESNIEVRNVCVLYLVTDTVLTWRTDAGIENARACLPRVLSRTGARVAGEIAGDSAHAPVLTRTGLAVVDLALAPTARVLQAARAAVVGRPVEAHAAVEAGRLRAAVVDLHVAEGARVAALAGALEAASGQIEAGAAAARLVLAGRA